MHELMTVTEHGIEKNKGIYTWFNAFVVFVVIKNRDKFTFITLPPFP